MPFGVIDRLVTGLEKIVLSIAQLGFHVGGIPAAPWPQCSA
jgi:hypothetical protein